VVEDLNVSTWKGLCTAAEGVWGLHSHACHAHHIVLGPFVALAMTMYSERKVRDFFVVITLASWLAADTHQLPLYLYVAILQIEHTGF
jgi:hypothetical protein